MFLLKSPVKLTFICLEAMISEGRRSGSFDQVLRMFVVTQYTNLLTPVPLGSNSGGLSG